jgi:hypothetical protein
VSDEIKPTVSQLAPDCNEMSGEALLMECIEQYADDIDICVVVIQRKDGTFAVSRNKIYTTTALGMLIRAAHLVERELDQQD